MHRFHQRNTVVVCAALALVAGSASAAATIVWIPRTAPNTIENAFTGLSPDGSVAVGRDIQSVPGNFQAIRWSASTGVQALSHLPGTMDAIAWDTSNQGLVTVGFEGSPNTAAQRAVMWNAAGAVTSLGTLSGAISSSAQGVNDDGTTIIGVSGSQAFRWTTGSGMVGLGIGAGFVSSSAGAVSGDGSVIVGEGGLTGGFGVGAWRWTQAGGFSNLGSLGGSFPFTRAQGVSGDGLTITGNAFSPSGFEAFRWTASTGIVGLGDLPGGAFQSFASGISADGSIIVGGSSSAAAGSEAFIWSALHGMRSLKAVLAAEFGLNLGSFLLEEASDISNDGTVISGWGRGPDGIRQGWVVTIPTPASATLLGVGSLALARRRRS